MGSVSPLSSISTSCSCKYRIQRQLRHRLVQVDDVPWSLDSSQSVRPLISQTVFPDGDGCDKDALRFVGGVDISFVESSNAAVACLDLQVVYEDYEKMELTVPYIAGFLAFREAAPFLELIRRVQKTALNPEVLAVFLRCSLILNEVILVDGNGILHPRNFGSACHLGVISGYPTIGVAKTLYCVDGLNERTVTEGVRQKINDLANRHPPHPYAGKPPPQQKSNWGVTWNSPRDGYVCRYDFNRGDDLHCQFRIL